MIIPVRCFTCHHVLADKWLYYERRVAELKAARDKGRVKSEDLKIDESDPLRFFDKNLQKEVLDELDLTRPCCRRHMLTHVDII